MQHDVIWMSYFSYFVSAASGFALQVLLNSKSEDQTFKNIIKKMGISATVSYLAYIVQRDYKVPFSPELWLFLASLSSTTIGSVLISMSAIGIRAYTNQFLKWTIKQTEEHEKRKSI